MGRNAGAECLHLVPNDVLARLQLRRYGECVDRVGRCEEVSFGPQAVRRLAGLGDLEPNRTED